VNHDEDDLETPAFAVAIAAGLGVSLIALLCAAAIAFGA
jgi:hypothetical protein